MLDALLLLAAGLLPDPAHPVLERAFSRLRENDYEQAISLFREAARLAPDRADIRKNLAYTLLKTGETEEARDQFAEVVRLAPADDHAALEYAFLCHETGQTRLARLVFDRVRRQGEPSSRETAERAFQNVDQPLAEGIARWQAVAAADPGNFSAHHELARLAEQRNELALAARHYRLAFAIKPAGRKLLVDLGRVLKLAGDHEPAMAALVAASRGAEPRAAEAARALLPERYPYVYEFRKALELDAANLELRRELAYLLLEMGQREEAEQEFAAIVEVAPGDLLSAAQLGFLYLQKGDSGRARPLLERVLAGDADDELADRVRSALGLPKRLRQRPDEPGRKVVDEARRMADRSYAAGYLKDALKYLTAAHENDPLDFDVMLKLGRTLNMLKQDAQAVRWFDMARYSPDPSVAAEAQQAYDNLRPAQAGARRTTVWMLPFYSSRWRDAFTYSQMKTEWRLPGLGLRPYASVRFVGDVRGAVNAPYPQYLSETAAIVGGGVATPVHKGLMGWAEAGLALSYLRRADSSGRSRPDYRGGVSYSRGFGRLLGAKAAGPFFENHEDAVFVSRFGNSLLFYTQNKAGYTFRPAESWADLRLQLYWNANLTTDARRQYWANFAETGPGVRLRWAGLPPSMVFSVDVVRGAHTINTANPRRPNYFDVRAGFWYAFTR